MSIKTHALWIVILSINSFQAYGQEWHINRKYEASYFKQDTLNCTTKFTNEIIQLIIDYALWRNVPMLYLIDESIKSGNVVCFY